MKWLLKWLFRLLILVIVLVVAFILLLDTMAKAITERQIKAQTGLDVTIGRMEVGLINPKFHLENLIAYNTPEYGGAPMINLPELHIEYNWRDLMMNHRLHLTLLRINLAEIHMVEGRDGRFNFGALESHISAVAKPGSKAEAEFGGIDTLNLSLGRLRFTSLKNPDTKGYYNVGIENWVITGIKKEEEIPVRLENMAKRKGLESLWEKFFGKPKKEAKPVLEGIKR
jgi:uncharacterized protein involved in outer membrane biogenesis